MIQIKNLAKHVGTKPVLRNITLSIMPGEMTIVVGNQGAGKSTLMHCIAGLSRFEGSITIDGHDCNTPEAKRLVGFVPECASLAPQLTVREHLTLIALAYDLTHWEPLADDLLERFHLTAMQHARPRALHDADRKKVSICCALLPKPRAIVLDEPLLFMDFRTLQALESLIDVHKQDGCAFVLSAHSTRYIPSAWDTLCALQDGMITRTFKSNALQDTDIDQLLHQPC